MAYWVSEKDQGMYHAIQKGFDKSTGEIMGWLNSDDMLHPGALFIMADIFSQLEEVEWIQGRPTNFDERSRTQAVSEIKSWSKYHFYARHFKWIQQESTFWRRSLWEKAGGTLNYSLKYAGDFELWLRFFRHAQLFSTIALIGGFRIRRSNQLSRDHMGSYLQEVDQHLSKEIGALLPKDKSRIIAVRIVLSFLSILKKLKVFKVNLIERKVFSKILCTPPIIFYNHGEEQFYLR